LIVLTREGALDRATVRVECRAAAVPVGALRERAERALKAATGLSIDVELLAPDELGRALAVDARIKARRIWDRRAEP
jgi:phenylacetate-coenzyme A ligase PaaK-like adenylate-forming protein